MELLIVIVLTGTFLLRRLLRKRPSKPRRRGKLTRKAHVTPEAVRAASPPTPRRRDEITGKAYVTDGDGIRVSGQEVRLAGLDAPEWNQPAKHADGYWFPHGKRVKRALIREIGGKHVHVTVERYDKFGRAVGSVTHNGRDIGEWLVGEGHAIAAYSDRYERVEREAKDAGRGMWNHEANIDPRSWRHRKRAQS